MAQLFVIAQVKRTNYLKEGQCSLMYVTYTHYRSIFQSSTTFISLRKNSSL